METNRTSGGRADDDLLSMAPAVCTVIGIACLGLGAWAIAIDDAALAIQLNALHGIAFVFSRAAAFCCGFGAAAVDEGFLARTPATPADRTGLRLHLARNRRYCAGRHKRPALRSA